MSEKKVKWGLRSRTVWICLLCAAFLLVVGASSVFAYVIIDGSKSETPHRTEETFTPGEVQLEVTTEALADGYRFTVRNVENIDAYVRVALICNWTAADGTVYYEAPNMVYTDSMDGWHNAAGEVTKYDWIESTKDTYFYYPAPIPANGEIEATIVVKDPTKVNGAIAPEGYTFTVTAIAEGIQATGKNANEIPAIQDVWKDKNGNPIVGGIDKDGILTGIERKNIVHKN